MGSIYIDRNLEQDLKMQIIEPICISYQQAINELQGADRIVAMVRWSFSMLEQAIPVSNCLSDLETVRALIVQAAHCGIQKQAIAIKNLYLLQMYNRSLSGSFGQQEERLIELLELWIENPSIISPL